MENKITEELMTETGLMAGRIWKYLDGKKEASDTELKIALAAPSGKMLLLAAGWLLRENKIIVREENKILFFSLKK